MEINLDNIAAEIGFDLAEVNKYNAKDFERIITKALGILVEDGLLAYAIWLESEDEEKIIDEIINKSYDLLKDKMGLIKNDYNGKDKLRKAILYEISRDIRKTLLARQLLERMLTYAKYRAKAIVKQSQK